MTLCIISPRTVQHKETQQYNIQCNFSHHCKTQHIASWHSALHTTWHYDTEHNETKLNDILHNIPQNNDILKNESQYNVSHHHKTEYITTQHYTTWHNDT